MKSLLNPAHIKPSQRDLVQFISPNQNAQSVLIRVQDPTGNDLDTFAQQMIEWETLEISALIIDVSHDLSLTEDYLSHTINALSCPLIRFAHTKNFDDVLLSRQLGFDSHILEAKKFTEQEIKQFHLRAQSMNYRLIFSVEDASDLQKIAPLQSRFVYCGEENQLEADALKTYFLLAPEALQNRFFIKCKIKQGSLHDR